MPYSTAAENDLYRGSVKVGTTIKKRKVVNLHLSTSNCMFVMLQLSLNEVLLLHF